MTIDQVPFAAAEGADGAIIAAPSHTCADRDAIESYARDVLDCADLAMGVYDNPRRVKTDLHWSNLLRLAEHPNMLAPKKTTTRVGQVAQICAAQPDMAITCCCSPNLRRVIPTMALGGHGTANMTGNLILREMAVISKPWNTGQDAFACRAARLEDLPVLPFAYSATIPSQ